MKRLSIKAVLSTLLLLLFSYLAFSGTLLYFGKTGLVMGITRNTLRETHFWVALLETLLILVHLLINRRLFLQEWKHLAARGRSPNTRSGDSIPASQEAPHE
ncbi:MAG: DUF4405 domain-containing protein [Clostridiales bacterium]|nr:DUF4405 domain-containing protein [Clostridiales bacterium]